MKSVGKWEFSNNRGFSVINGIGFTFSSDEIYFLTDNSASDEENEQIFRAFSKVVPSAVGQIRKSFETGKNFEGNYDGWHVKATFDRFGKIYITN